MDRGPVGEPAIVRCPDCKRRNRIPPAATGTPRCADCRSSLPWLVNAGDDDFAEIADRSPLPVLVDWWAPWCAPCRMVAPAVERLTQELAGRIKAVKVNVDEAPRTAARFDARSIPTLLLLRDGRVVARQVGALPADRLGTWVRGAL